MHIAVIYNLPTERAKKSAFVAADEDTGESAVEVRDALVTKGHEAFLVPVSAETLSVIDQAKADLIFNLIEWSGADIALGVEACRRIVATGIPYTGATPESYEQISRKVEMKKALDVLGLPSARWQSFTMGKELVRPDFTYPVIVKLAEEHCSIGLTADSIVKNQEQLAHQVEKMVHEFSQPVYAEEFLDGREFQVTALEKADGLWVLPPAEIVYKNSSGITLLTFNSRWDENHPDYKTSTIRLADFAPDLKQKIDILALRTFAALAFRDYARLDLRMRDGELYLLEANCNPGLGDDDEYGMTISYRAVGLTFADFIMQIVSSSRRRFAQLR